MFLGFIALAMTAAGAAKMSFTIVGFYTAVSTNRTGAHIRTNKFSFAGNFTVGNDFGPQKSYRNVVDPS